MSNRNPDSNYDQVMQALEFFWGEKLKTIHTAIPGLIQAYTAATRRAIVQPAIDLLSTDNERLEKRPLANVPVLHPAGGGYVVHLPLQQGDPVMLLFSERGLTEFKKTYQRAAPDVGAVLDEGSAVAIPGFGALALTPAGEGLTVQSEDGSTFAHLLGDLIRLDNSTTSAEIDGDRLTLTNGSASIEISGSTVRIAADSITLDSAGDTLVVQ